MNFGKALSVSVIFVLLFSLVSAGHGTMEDALETQCQAMELDSVEAPEGVTLNGEDVDEIECSNIEAYSFDHNTAEMSGPGLASSSPNFSTVALVFLPPLIFFAVAVIVSWRKSLGWKRPLLFFVGAVVSFMAQSGLIWAIGTLNSGYHFLSLAVPLLLGLAALPLYILYREDFRSREVQSEALVSFLFVAGINWSVVGFIFFTQRSLTAFGA